MNSGGYPDVSVQVGDLFDPNCPTRELLTRIGTKWVSMIIARLEEADELRFAELRWQVPGISQKMLSHTLSGLVADGLIRRRVEPSVPPAVYYSLTDLGWSLTAALAQLRTWAQDHMAEIDRNRQQTS